MHQLEYNRRTKPTPHKLRYNSQFWGRMGGQPALFLPLMEGAGNPRDYSPNHNAMTIFGGATWATESYGRAMNFDGTSGGVVGNLQNLSPSIVTAAAICYCNAYTLWGTAVKNWGSVTSGQFHLGIDSSSDTLSCYLTQSGGATVKVIDTVALPLKVRQLLAFVADGATARLYRSINGVVTQVASAAYDGTLRTSFKPVGVGAKPNDTATGIASSANPGYWNGWIESAVVLPAALSVQKLQRFYDRPWAMFTRRRPRVAATAGGFPWQLIGGGMGSFIGN